MGDNIAIVNCFVVAAVIAFVGAIFGVQLTYMATKALKQEYSRFLNDQKNLAISTNQMKESEKDGAVDLEKVLEKFESQNKVYEYRELFKNDFAMDQETIIKEKLEFKFSLFQIPALILDYIFRQKVIDSFAQFLLVINESKAQFASSKMKRNAIANCSMHAYELQVIYSDFCQREGYKELDILEKAQRKTLKGFGITVDDGDDVKEPAYVNIRFMTKKEKQQKRQS